MVFLVFGVSQLSCIIIIMIPCGKENLKEAFSTYCCTYSHASNSVPTTRSTTSKATSEADEKKKNKVVKSLEDNLSIIQRLERRP